MYVFDFLLLLLNIWEDFKVLGPFMLNESNLLLVWISVCMESCLPIAWRTFIWWKISQSAALFWFRLQDVGILYSLQAVIQRTIDVSPAILEHGPAEKISVWAHTNRDLNKQEVGFMFAWRGSQLWTLIKYSRSKMENKKPIAVDVLFKAYPMVPLSCRSNLAVWYL